MAFESFRTQDRRQHTKLRRIVIGVAAVFHGVLIAAGVIYSYWHVDELTPPTLRVTFIAARTMLCSTAASRGGVAIAM